MLLDAGMRDYDLRTVPEYARKVEAIGYDCLWTSETQHDPFLPLADALTTTSSLKMGTSIAVAFPRSPMVIAYTAWDIQRASSGRFILGLGSQVRAHNQRRFSVKFESPGPKLREVVLALRAIWECWQQGTPLRFRGKFYKQVHDHCAANRQPYQRVPVVRDRGICRVARYVNAENG